MYTNFDQKQYLDSFSLIKVMAKQSAVNKIKQGLRKEQQKKIEDAVQTLKEHCQEGGFVFEHCLRTGLWLKKMKAPEQTIIAGLLHHLPEEKAEPFSKIVKKVNQLQELIQAIRIAKSPAINKWEKTFLNTQASNLTRMFFALAQTLDPVFVVLAEQLDQMHHLKALSQKEQKKKANLALRVFAPLAYGIGMGELKGRFEDLAFPVLYAKEYQWLLKESGSNYEQRTAYLKKIKPLLGKILTKQGIEFLDIHSRAKHYFSLYQKLLRYDMDLDKIYDLVAMRLIVPSVKDCYKALGAIHRVWPPLPQRIKDYIACPKPNGYRSLHTTVFCVNNKKTEFQIKTKEMHQEAEYGLAAHLSYKAKIGPKKYKHQSFWMEKLRQWQAEIQSPEKISEHLKSKLLKNRVFVFTPQKDVINLPKDATPVDFAYAVHTEVGHHCQGARIDNNMASLKKKLKTGQTIEILTEKNQTPSLDWLRFVKTKRARSKIRNFFQKAQGIAPVQPSKAAIIKDKVKVIKKVLPFQRKKALAVLVGGETNIKIKLSQCCEPKQGDSIVAFITAGEGASLHRKQCRHLQELEQKWPQRVIKAKWLKNTEK